MSMRGFNFHSCFSDFLGEHVLIFSCYFKNVRFISHVEASLVKAWEKNHDFYSQIEQIWFDTLLLTHCEILGRSLSRCAYFPHIQNKNVGLL